MDMTTLRCLVSLADLGSLTAAAREQHLTQPAVSIRLRKLEAELGARLFHPGGRPARFTPAGEAALAAARRMIAGAEELRRELADLEGLAKGRIAIGTIDAASAYVLPGVFSRFRRRYPGIEIHLEVTATSPLVAAVRSGALELAVGTMPVEAGGDLETYPVYTERLSLIAPAGHPLAGRRRVEAAELTGRPFIAFHEGAVTRRIVERELRRRGAEPRVTMTTDSPDAIRTLVGAGLGMAVLPERVVREDLRRGILREVRVPGLVLQRTLGLIIPARRYLSAPARAFLGELASGLGVRLPDRLVEGGTDVSARGSAGPPVRRPGGRRRKDA